jgi:rhodanese-related sulfurtransferase
MRRIALIVLAFVSLSSCSEAQENTPTGNNGEMEAEQMGTKRVVSAADFKAMLSEDIQLIDVRTPGEVSGGKIENAQNIDFNGANFKAELEKLDKNKKTLVYCAAGGRSGKAAQMMQDMGFKEVYDLQGGYGGWPYK